MAQVKKFQPGGEIKKLSEGGIWMNGEFYNKDDVNEMVNNIPYEYRDAVAGIISGVNNEGKQYTYDPNGNSIGGDTVVDDISSFFENDPKKIEKITTDKGNKFRPKWDAFVGNKRDEFNRGLSYFRLLGTSAAPKKNKEDVKKELEPLMSGSGWFYKDNGTFDDSLDNEKRYQIINGIMNYLGKEDKSGYNVNNWDKLSLDYLNKWYSGLGDSGLGALWDRVKQKQLTNEDVKALNAMGFFDNPKQLSPEEVAKVEQQNQINKIKEIGGYDDDTAKWLSLNFNLGDDGLLHIINGTDFYNLYGDKNRWFNNIWERNNGQYAMDLPWLKGHILYNGRLFRETDPRIQGYLSTKGGFADKNKVGNFIGSNNDVEWLWGDEAGWNRYDDKNYYSEFLKGLKNPFFRAANNYIGLDLNDGEQLIQYFDASDPRDWAGYVTSPRFAILDSEGKLVRELNPEEYDMLNTDETIDIGDVNMISRINGSGNKRIEGKQLLDIVDPNGYEVAAMYIDPEKEGDVLLNMAGIRGGGTVRLPIEVGTILAEKLKNPDFRDRFVADKKFQKQLLEAINGMYETGFGQNRSYAFMMPGLIFGADRNNITKNSLRSMGFNEDEIQQIRKGFKRARTSGNAVGRRVNYFTTTPRTDEIRIEKEGGNIPKYQFGGSAMTGKSGGVKGNTNQVFTDTEWNNPSDNHKIGSGQQLSNQDWADLAALGADLGSLGLAFVPGANVGSAAIGAAGSTARFVADLQRPGANGQNNFVSDIGNYALNLGMDAATLLPLVGGEIKSVKIAKAIKNVAPTLIKAFSVYGIGDAAIMSVKKIQSGDQWTIRDISRVVNGLTAGVGLYKSGLGSGKQKNTKVIKPGENSITYKVKGKDGETKFDLNESQLKEIKDSKKKDKTDLFKKFAAENYNKGKTEADQIKVEDIENVNSTFVKAKTKTEYDYDEKILNEWDTENKTWKDWFLGTGAYTDYNRTLAGMKPRTRNVLKDTYVSDINDSGSSIIRVLEPGKVPSIFTPNTIQHVYPQELEGIPYGLIEDEEYIPRNIYYKEGGKIEKGENGLFTPKIDWNKLGQLKFDTNTNYTTDYSIDLKNPKTSEQLQQEKYNIFSTPQLQQGEFNPSTGYIKPVDAGYQAANKSEKTTSTDAGYQPEDNIQYFADTFDYLRQFGVIKDANKVGDLMDKAYYLQSLAKKTPINLSDYKDQTTLLNRQTNDAIDKYRIASIRPNLSADGTRNYQIRRDIQAQENDIRERGNASMVNSLLNTENQNIQQDNKEVQYNTQVADTNRAIDINSEYSRAMNNANVAGVKANAWEGFWTDRAQKLRDEENDLRGKAYNSYISAAQRNVQQTIDDKMKKLSEESGYNSIDEWRKADPNGYKKSLNAATMQSYNANKISQLALNISKSFSRSPLLQNWNLNEIPYGLSTSMKNGGVLTEKTGGKTSSSSSKYQRKSAEEEIRIDKERSAQKHIDASVRQLNKHVEQILSKLIK